MITYRVDVYRSGPIGASLLTTSPQQGCLALNGLHTGWLGVVTGIRLIQISTGGFLVLYIGLHLNNDYLLTYLLTYKYVTYSGFQIRNSR